MMSTRSLIGFQDNQGVVGIYCHYDGNPEHVGKILIEHHNSTPAMLKLITGAQIRNFDHDGQYARFTDDGDESAAETFESVEQALNDCFDYVYLFTDKWECYTLARGIGVKRVRLYNKEVQEC
jgi:hypothetical protein